MKKILKGEPFLKFRTLFENKQKNWNCKILWNFWRNNKKLEHSQICETLVEKGKKKKEKANTFWNWTLFENKQTIFENVKFINFLNK